MGSRDGERAVSDTDVGVGAGRFQAAGERRGVAAEAELDVGGEDECGGVGAELLVVGVGDLVLLHRFEESGLAG